MAFDLAGKIVQLSPSYASAHDGQKSFLITQWDLRLHAARLRIDAYAGSLPPRGSHLSKSTKGGAASFVVVQRWASHSLLPEITNWASRFMSVAIGLSG
jgi:hypothetical protein